MGVETRYAQCKYLLKIQQNRIFGCIKKQKVRPIWQSSLVWSR